MGKIGISLVFLGLLSFNAWSEEFTSTEGSNNSNDIVTVSAGKAFTWLEARSQCQDLGQNWDLPQYPNDFITLVDEGKGVSFETILGQNVVISVKGLWVLGQTPEENNFFYNSSWVITVRYAGRQLLGTHPLNVSESEVEAIKGALIINDVFMEHAGSDSIDMFQQTHDDLQSQIDAYGEGFPVVCVQNK